MHAVAVCKVIATPQENMCDITARAYINLSSDMHELPFLVLQKMKLFLKKRDNKPGGTNTSKDLVLEMTNSSDMLLLLWLVASPSSSSTPSDKTGTT